MLVEQYFICSTLIRATQSSFRQYSVLSTQYLHRRGVKQSCENLFKQCNKKKPTEGPRGGGVDGAPALQHGVSVFFSALTTGVKDCWFLM